jgi:carbon-monoxide dehydrogenase large subunit
VEDARFLRGAGRYVGDMSRPGMLHAAFLRSPHAHARIARVDLRGALAVRGVAACADGAAMSAWARPIRAESRMPQYHATEWPALARDRVRYAGEAVAIVLARDRYVAEDALERIAVDYEPLPAVTDPARALDAASPVVHGAIGTNRLLAREFAVGDVDAALAAAPVIVRDRFRFHRHAGLAIENRAALAEYQPGAGHLTLWSSTQTPGLVREGLATSLGLPVHAVRVVAPDVGGGFGVKTPLYPEELAVAAMARQLGRPVRWVGDRREDLLTTTQAWDEVIDAELAVDRDGHILGLRAEVLVDVGAYSIYPWTAAIEAIQTISFLPGPYRIPSYRGRAVGVATNKAPMGPYRGVGRPVSTFVTEGLVDRAAHALGTEPAEIRRRNFIRPQDLPYRSPSGVVWDTGSFGESLETALAALGDVEAAPAGQLVGAGIASYVELTGIGSAIPVAPGMAITVGTEAATIRIDAGGTVTAVFGLASHGQGHETAFAQVVADELGVTPADVRVVHGDTAASPHGTGTYASRSAVLGGGAAILASRELRAKVLRIAAHQLEAAPEDLAIEAGRIHVRGVPERVVPLSSIARAAYTGTRRLPDGVEPGLEVTRFYDPYFGTASNATHVAVVAVDPETFAVRLLRYVVADDCGRIINPLIVDGQLVGGIAQGIGAALLEEVVYDADGQLLSGTLMDYVAPTAVETSPVAIVHLERPSPTTLGGFKGVGEGGTIGAPAALANAISAALRSLGIWVNELPATPSRLRAAARRGPT